MRNKKNKIITLSILTIAVIFTVIFAVGAADDTSTEYWKLVQMDIDDYRKDESNYTAPEYDNSGEWLFAGWFDEEGNAVSTDTTTGTYYAKFVPADILGVQAQVNSELYDKDTTNDDTKTYKTIDEETGETVETEGNAGAIRFVTSVDTLKYSKIGFKIKRGDKTEEDRANNTVYKQLYATGEAADGTEKTDKYVASDLFNADASTYFKTWTYTKVPSSAYDMDITVTPYWVTLDGTTVKGTTSIKCVNQGRQWKYIFVDDTGSVDENGNEIGTGTRGCPYATLNGALAHIQEYGESKGGQVWILDSFTATSDFSWDEHGLDVTIKGDTVDTTNSSTISFGAIGDLKIGDAATFESLNLTFNTDTLYANGHRLEIAKSVVADTTNSPKIYGGSTDDTVESTSVTLYTGSYANIYGGGESEDVSGDTYVHIGGDVNASSRTLYAGSYQATVSGDTCVIVDGNAQINYVYAGGNDGTVSGDTYATIGDNALVTYVRGAGNGASQIVEGTCYVTIEDYATISGVNGGGANGSANNTYVVVKGGTIEQVLGGQTTSGGTVNNTNVHILGGTITRRVYGGSYNDYSSLKWQGTNSVAGYSSVTISPDATISSRTDDNLLKDTSICAVSRAEENYLTEVGVMILNYGTNSDEVGFSSAMKAISNASYTHFLVNVVENGASGTVTSESGVLRITPDTAGAYATVTEPDGDTVVIKGEGTYSLSGLAKTTSVQEITVTFSNTVSEEPSGDYVLSYGDDSYSYFSSLTDAMAAVSTPSVNTNGVYEEKTATITIGAENVTVDSTLALTDGDNVVLKNAEGKNVTLTRTSGNTMFNIAYGCSLTIDGTIVVDGNKDNSIFGSTLVMNEGTFTLGEGATLQNAATEATSNTSSYSGAALYNTGNAYISGSMKNNYAYAGGAIYVASGVVELANNNDAVFSGNSSNKVGGAIYIANSATLNAKGYTFQNNTSGTNGGVLGLASGSNVNLTDCIFDNNNSASGYSGGVMYGTGTISVDNCTYKGNSANTGGAICVYESSANTTLSIINSSFEGNESSTRGSAIDINGGKSVVITACTFSKNDDAGSYGSTIQLHTNGKQVDISDISFEGNAEGNKDVIYMHNANNILGISGKIADVVVKISKSAAQVKVNGKVDNDSNITITPTYTYAEGTQVVTKADETISDLKFKNAIKVLGLTQVSGNYWFIDSTGCLSQVSATINGTEGSYADALAAIAAGGTVEVQFIRDVEIADTITIPTGADVTITNASDTKVTLTRATTSEMFNVEADAKLTLGSENSAKAFIIDGADLSGNSLIKNAGTFSSYNNIMIKNANAGSNNGGVLYNTGTATLAGTYTNNTATKGAVVYNTGTVTVKDGTYSYNIATSGGGVVYSDDNDSIVNVEAGMFEYNEAQGGTSGVIYGKATVTITGGTFQYNKATSGGAIMNVAGSCEATIKNATIIENSLTATTGTIYNGAIYVSGNGILNLEDCNIYNNNSHYRSLTNPGCDVGLGADVTLNLKNNSNVGIIQQRYTNAVATINIKESYTGSITLLPYNDTYTIGSRLIIFDETLSDAEKTASVRNIVVRDYVSSASDYTDDMYCVDTDGLLQYKNAEAKVGTITYLTLEEAISAATSGDTVYVLKDVEMNEPVAIGDSENAKEITITNAVGRDVTITRTSTTSLFTVASGSTLTIGSADTANKLIVDGGSVYDAENDEEKGITASTSMIVNEGTFNLKANATLQNANVGTESVKGGALSTAGAATIDGTLKNNRAYQGGAIYANAPDLKVVTSASANMEYNNAAAGGAVYVNAGTLESTGTTFSYNKSTTNGGAIVSNYNTGCIDLNGCTFGNNESAQSGGAVYARFEVIADGCTFESNEAGTSGGAICVYDGSNNNAKTEVKDSTFISNISVTRASAIDIIGGESKTVTVSGCTFSGNDDASTYSSTIQVQVASSTVLSDCTFNGNAEAVTDRIYMYHGSSTLALSGKVSAATVVKVEKEQLILNGAISEDSNIIITPKTYSEGAKILIASDSISAEELAKAANIINVTPNDEGEWYISHEGILLPATVKAQVGTTYYTDVDDAIEAAIATLSDADSTATVYVLNDTSMDTGVEITTGTLVVTNAPGKDVELTRALEDTLFTVSAEAVLQIGSDTSGRLVIDGGYIAEPVDGETSIIANSLVINTGTFTLEANATIQKAWTVSSSDYKGGALNNTGDARIYGDLINNKAYNGGAIYSNGGSLLIDGGNITNNAAFNNGGAIATTINATISNAVFSSNTSKGGGGAVYCYNSTANSATVEITNTNFSLNTTTGSSGGAIYCNQKLIVNGGVFSGNSASTYGGVINVAGSAEISNATMYGNTVSATNCGSAIYVSNGKTLKLTGCNIYNNETCDIRFYSLTTYNKATITGITANDGDDSTTECCYIYKSSSDYYVIPEQE